MTECIQPGTSAILIIGETHTITTSTNIKYFSKCSFIQNNIYYQNTIITFYLCIFEAQGNKKYKMIKLLLAL